MKKLFSYLLSIILTVGLICNPCNAQESSDESSEGALLEKMMSDTEKYESIRVYDSIGNDYTEKFFDVYTINGIKTAYEFISNQNCTIQFRMVEDNDNTNIISPNAVTQSKTVSDIFYHIGTGSGFTKEWAVILKGTFWYNVATDAITSASAPQLSIYHAGFGTAFSPYLGDVGTDKRVNSSTNTVTFTATHTMYATLTVSIGQLPLGRTINFGSYTDSFSYTYGG